VIIYFSRLNGRIRDFPVYFSKTLFERMKERARTLHKHIKTNTETQTIQTINKNGWITFNISSIDYWSIILFEPEQPITYTSLDLNTQTATPDQEITITLTLYNPNHDQTHHTPAIKIDGNQLEIDTITIPGRETETITKKIQLEEGSHTISTENMEKQITIQTPEEPQPEQEEEEETETTTETQEPQTTQNNAIPGYNIITITVALLVWIISQNKQGPPNLTYP